jgi:hypothetical protein
LGAWADAFENAPAPSSARKTPARQKIKPIKTRGLKKADVADFFFIGNFPRVYAPRYAYYRSGSAVVTLFLNLFRFLNAAAKYAKVNRSARQRDIARTPEALVFID